MAIDVNTGIAYAVQTLCKRIVNRQGDYETQRALVDAQTDEICELFRPDLVKGKVGEKKIGAFEGSKIVEGTGPYSALIWQRGFLGSMLSRKSDWFKDRLKEPPSWTGIKFKGNDQVNQYLQDFDDHVSSIYKRSNYYDVMPNFVLDAGTVGSPVMLKEQDIINDRLIFKVPNYSQRWLAKDIFGRDNVVHIKWEWNAIEALEFFGKDQLPSIVKQQLKNGTHYIKSQYLQVIYPAGDPIFDNLPKAVDVTHPWMEFFVFLDNKDQTNQKTLKPLNKGPGYFTRPFSTWHYWRNWHEVYGRSMAWWAIYDVKGCNAMWEALFGEAEMSVRPPTWAMGELCGLLDLGPGGQNWADSVQSYQTPPMFLNRGANFNVAIDFADRIKGSIERHFHVPLFMMVNQLAFSRNQPETAYGLFRMEAERTGQLAPQVETYENQVLGDTHESILDMERMAEPAYPWGRLPQPPDIVLENSEGVLDVEFIGQLSMAQVRDRTINNFYRNIGISELVFGIKPETIEKVKWSTALERVLEAGNFAQNDIVPEEEYQALIQAMNQRAKQAELAEQAPKITQAVKNLQGVTEKQSPLKLLTGAA